MTADGKPTRRRKRIWVFIALLLLPFVLLFLFTRSFLLSPIVSILISNSISGEVLVGEASWDWSGKLDLTNVRVVVSEIKGNASEVISIPAVELEFTSILPLSLTSLKSITADTILVRIAESAEKSGDYNISRIIALPETNSSSVETNSSSADTFELPEIYIQSLVLESGSMNGEDWMLDSKKEFAIELGKTEADVLAITLQDVDSPALIDLEVSNSTFQLSIDDAELNQSIVSFLPRTVRIWCEETELSGGMKSLLMRWNKETGFAIEANVENMHFFLPEKHGLRWSHYDKGIISRIRGNASLEVSKGTIVYDGESVLLTDIEGELKPPHQEHNAPVSFRAELKIYDLPNMGNQEGSVWMKSMLDQSPFEASFFIDEFHAAEEGEADLPIAAAEVLKLFQLEQWKIASKVKVKREVAGEDPTVEGELIISAANGMYEGFPYPLHDISTSITFHGNTIEIVFLNATGSDNSKVHISGTVTAAPEKLVVDLNLHAPAAPLDETLREALPSDLANVMGRLFDKKAYEQMADTLPESYENAFSFGGVIDLDLDISHDSSKGENVTVAGEVLFEDVGIMFADFPFPVTLQKGMVHVDSNGIYISEDEAVHFRGTGGGDGELSGSITFLEGGLASPNLRLELINEWITPSLITAVSSSSGESHDLALGVLSGLGLESRLTAVGNITGNKDGGINTNFLVNISEGIAIINSNLADAINATGQFWPDGFQFEGVEAKIYIENGVVTMDGATCECGLGSVEVSMAIDGETFDLILRGTELPLSPQFVDVLPANASVGLSNAWYMLNPTGFMDATIRMSRLKDEHTLNMEIVPKILYISGKEEKTSLELVEGSVIVENTNVFLNDLKFELKEENKSSGDLEIIGSVHGSKEAFSIDIAADWKGASIDSPLTRAITGIVGGDAGIDYYDILNPSGTAEAALVAVGDSDSISYDIVIIPTDLSATFNNRRAVAEFGSEKKNVIHFDNNGISFQNIDGKLGDGVFSLDGIVDTAIGINGVFKLTWEGPSDDSSLFAVLPSAVGDTLQAIEIKEGHSKMPKGAVTLTGESWEELSVGFAGNILLDEVSVDVGVPLNNIVGKVKVDGTYDNKRLSELALSLEVDEMVVLGRLVNFVTGRLLLDTNSKRLLFEDMGGESTTGGVSVQGWIGMGESKEFEIEIAVSDAKIAAKEEDDALASLEGELTGWLSVAGVRGDARSKRGVGELRVRNGKLKVDPLSNTAMHLLQLTLPTANTITGAKIDLYIVGDKVVLDGITLTSSETSNSDLVLNGEGTIDISTFELNARLHPRVGLPIIRDIVGAINETFYAIDVTGELFNPTVSIVPLPFLSPQEK
ncbi:MAG: hypothetical protein HOC21_01085 [Phycisphaerae bacterium]|nr:hypothetical protein [Phycisphaerae bacterium]